MGYHVLDGIGPGSSISKFILGGLSPAPIVAPYQARFGVTRFNAFFAGWTPPSVTAYINATDRTTAILREGWSLRLRTDGEPATFTFTTKTITPVVGQDVKVLYATPDDYLFGGTLLQREVAPEAPGSDVLCWRCTAVSYQWLLDRHARVLAQYASTGVSTVVGDILDRFTDGGFSLGECPESFGNVTMTFTNETVWGSLQRIAQAVGAVLEITPAKIINLYLTYPGAGLATVTENTILARSLTYREDLTQIRTRNLFAGAGSTVASAAPAGASIIAVDDTTPFQGAARALCGRNDVAFTGVSTASGAGSLTGCSGVLYDIAANDAINLLVEVEDTAAQTALATILGGGLSGIATDYQDDARFSVAGATATAGADLTRFSGALKDTSFTYKTPQRYVRAGRSVTLAVTAPVAITGTLTIQSVTMEPYGVVGGAYFEVRQAVDLSTATKSIPSLLLERQ